MPRKLIPAPTPHNTASRSPVPTFPVTLIGHHSPLQTLRYICWVPKPPVTLSRAGRVNYKTYFPHNPFAVQSDAMVIHGCDASWRMSTRDRRCSVPVTESLIG